MVQTGPKRAVQAGAGLALVAGLLALPVTAAIANPATGQLATPELAVSDATSSLASHASALRASAADKFTARGSLVDANGVRHVRFDRTYQGLPVLGGDIIAHNSANGAFLDASVTLSAPLNLAVTPKISAADATATGITRFTGTKATQAAPRLAVDATGAPALVWQVIVAGTDAQGIASRLDVTVDALTGAIRSSHETIPTLAPRGTTAKAGTAASVATVGAAAGTGNGLYSGSVPISINQQSGGLYELKDPTRGNTEIYDAQNKSAEAGVPITSSTTTFGNGTNSNRASAGVDASYGAAKTWDYYKNVLGRTGIDGSGTGAHMYVHYGNAYDNAYWSDGCYCMVFGDGSNNKSFTELDVIGHEMSHGVTSRTAALDYSGDAGGLNEANSDIFGTEVEFYAANANDNPDYLIGELLDLNGDGSPLRYMDDPHKDGVSDSCWTTSTGGKDPHYSSGVGNHLFFLLAVGSGAHTVNGVSYNSPTCASAPAVTGIGNDKAGKIWFKALSTYMNATESYPKARIDTIHAANDMITAGTATNADCTNLKAAWKAAGVAVQTTEAACLGGGGGNSAPTVTNPGNQTTQVSTAVNLQIAASDADGDALTYSATGLPAGLSINASTGKITGTTAATASSNSVVVSVKDPTHTAVTASFTWAVTTTTPPTCTVTQIGNSGFETGAATPWTASSGVVDNSASQAAHGGSWKAWMNGYGSTHADSLSQSIKVPSGCASVSLQYYLHIDTAETGSTVYDKLTVTVGTTTVASYSNVNAAAGYQLRTVNLSAFAGQTVTLKFAGSEDSSLQTSFVVDDVTIVGS